MISRDKSIKNPSDFYKLKKEGDLVKSSHFQIRYFKNSSGLKVAFVVSKVITPNSPKRNKLKRIYKALLKDSNFDQNITMVIYPRLSSLSIKYSELKIEFESVLKKINI